MHLNINIKTEIYNNILYGNFTSPCSNVLQWKPSYLIVISRSFDEYESLDCKYDCSHVRVTKYFTIKDKPCFILFLLYTFYLLFYIINYTAVFNENKILSIDCKTHVVKLFIIYFSYKMCELIVSVDDYFGHYSIFNSVIMISYYVLCNV